MKQYFINGKEISEQEAKVLKTDDYRHCSECVHYETCPNYQMYCKALQRRITARKTPRYCKYYEIRQNHGTGTSR